MTPLRYPYCVDWFCPVFLKWYSQDSVGIYYPNSTEIQWKIPDCSTKFRWGSGETQVQLRGLQEGPEYSWVLWAIWTLSVLAWSLDLIWLPQRLACAASCCAQSFPWVLWAGDVIPSSSPMLTADTQPEWSVWTILFHAWTEGIEAWTESFDLYKSFEGHFRRFRICRLPETSWRWYQLFCTWSCFPTRGTKILKQSCCVKNTTGNR